MQDGVLAVEGKRDVGSVDIPIEGLRLSLGCGRHTVAGWFCIDAEQNPNADRPLDMISDVKSIALPDVCATEIVAIHLFEHLYRWECDDVIEEWKRLLRPSGRLSMEMPDLLKLCRNVLNGRNDGRHPDQLGMWGLYGDPREMNPLMVHRWSWTFATIKPFLESHGFTDCKESETQWHPVGRGVRDFRVTARKA
jgi:predicted SAM-dependent methyltransferase